MKRLRERLFDFLATADPPVPSDAIFVLAGRPERKRYGLELYRKGIAPALILSVARFEWRGFPDLGLPDDGGLQRLVRETYYKRRHFFVTVNRDGVRARFVPTHFLGTHREALGLAEEIRTMGYRSILVVSTSLHLRRARLSLGRALRGLPVRIAYTAVPDSESGIRRDGWSRSTAGWGYVTGEMLKLAVYRLLPL